MKKNKMMIGATVASLLLVSISAEAKFGVKLPAAPSGGGGGDISGLKASIEDDMATAILDCTAARLAFVEAQERMTTALDLKEKCGGKLSEMRALTEGNTSGSNLEKISKIGDEVNAEIIAKMEVIDELSPEQKAEFSKGVGCFISGMALEAKQVHVAIKLGEMAKEITEKASGLDKAAAAAVAVPALKIAAMIPGDVKKATSTMVVITKFSKKQNIDIPSQEKSDEAI